MNKNLATLCIATALLAPISSTAIFAAEPATPGTSNTQLLATLGVTFGGDELATVEYTNGDSYDVRAGGLVLFGIGFDHQFGNGWELQSSINYHTDQANARNGDVSFTRIPLDVLGFYRSGNHRVGGGITYHMDPEFEIDLPGKHGSEQFDNALGAVLEYDYFFGSSFSIGLRGTLIEYDASDFDYTVSGNYVGLMLNAYFF